MIIKFLTLEALNDLRGNFQSYKNHYISDDNQAILRIIQEKDGFIDSGMDIGDFSFVYGKDYNKSDFENSKRLYSALITLPRSAAVDERLWSGLSHGQFWDFIQYRRKEELISKEDQDIMNSYFFTRGRKRSAHIHCISRLWWAGHMTYDNTRKDPFELADVIFDGAFASTLVLLSSSNLTANHNLRLALLECLHARKLKGEKISRDHFVDTLKYLNGMGSVTILDALSKDDLKNIIEKFLIDRFGK